MSKKGVLLTFDFVIKDLKKYYSYTSPKNAYKIIGEYLVENGFEKTRDSDYISYTNTMTKAYKVVDKFAESNKWFTPSLKKLSITPISELWDLFEEYKLLYNDTEFIKQKEKEYRKKINKENLL